MPGFSRFDQFELRAALSANYPSKALQDRDHLGWSISLRHLLRLGLAKEPPFLGIVHINAWPGN